MELFSLSSTVPIPEAVMFLAPSSKSARQNQAFTGWLSLPMVSRGASPLRGKRMPAPSGKSRPT